MDCPSDDSPGGLEVAGGPDPRRADCPRRYTTHRGRRFRPRVRPGSGSIIRSGPGRRRSGAEEPERWDRSRTPAGRRAPGHPAGAGGSHGGRPGGRRAGRPRLRLVAAGDPAARAAAAGVGRPERGPGLRPGRTGQPGLSRAGSVHPCHAARVREFAATAHARACRRPPDGPMPAGFEPGRGHYATVDPGCRSR